MSKKGQTDIEKTYPKKDFIAKLHRLINALEHNQRFVIQIAGKRITVPADATINIEYEGGSKEE